MSANVADPPLILASGSRYRSELLGRLGVSFESVRPDVDETPLSGETGEALALRLAADKAAVVAASRPGAIVIGSDQVAVCRTRLLGKPGGRERAIEQLAACSGADVVFHTAVTLRRDDTQRSACIDTRVRMRQLAREAIERYVDRDRPFDCAGAMKSEALGISLAHSISSDDPTALIGLPLTRVVALLAEFGLGLP